MSDLYELSEELKKKAWENLREDESLRNQSLEQFREWIEKHPKIKKCPMDSKFLLRFLRTKKFSVPDAIQLLEKYLSTRKVLPELFDKLNLDDPAIRHLLTKGSILLVPEPDKEGRLVIMFDSEHYDPNKFTTIDGIRCLNFILELANLDERAQICGVVHVMDWSNISLPFIGMWTVPQIKNFTRCWQKTFPVRHGAFFFVNLPAYSIAFSKIVTSCLSAKLRDRVYMGKSWESVYESLGSSMLPLENGGKVPREELAKDLLKLAEKHKDDILSPNDFDIEVSKSDLNFGDSYDADLDSAIVGSFRKINVD